MHEGFERSAHPLESPACFSAPPASACLCDSGTDSPLISSQIVSASLQRSRNHWVFLFFFFTTAGTAGTIKKS